MGTGYRIDPSLLTVKDISETHTCPLARKLRRNLREAGIEKGIPVIWSAEKPFSCAEEEMSSLHRRTEVQGAGTSPASMIFVPASAGLLMASFIVRKLIDQGMD